jgi:hypothetical protein
MKTASPRSTVPPIFRRRALPSPQAAVDRERIRSGQAGHQLLRQRDLRRKTYDARLLALKTPATPSCQADPAARARPPRVPRPTRRAAGAPPH